MINRHKSWLIIAVLALAVGAVPGRAGAMLVIQEVLYDGTGSDAEQSFTELYGLPGLDLTGWQLVGVNGSDGASYRTVNLTGGVVPGDGVFLVATGSAIGAVATHRDFVGSVDWQNGPDAVQLLDPDGIVVDALQYGDAGEFNSGEGLPALDVDAGFSLSRDAFGTDNDNNASDFMVLDIPTPGFIDSGSQPIPEPGTMFLLGMGLVGVTGLRKRRRTLGK